MSRMNYFTGVLDRKSTAQEIGDDIGHKFKKGLTANQDARDRAKDYLNYFKGIPDALPEWHHPDDPNYFVPYMEVLVDTIVAKFFLTLFAHNPIIRYQPQDRASILSTRIVERLIHYQINHQIPDALTHLYLWVQDAVLQGYGFLNVYWDKQSRIHTEEVTVTDPITEEPLFDNEGKEIIRPMIVEEIDYQGFKFDVLDIEDVVADWNEIDFKASYVIVREYINPEEYFDRMKGMEYEKLTEEQIDKAIVPYDRFEDSGEREREDKTKMKLELLHYYGKGYLDGGEDDELQDIKITILTHSTGTDGVTNYIVKKESLGFKPFCILRFKPEKGRLLGRGVGDQTYDLNTELNLNFNARILNISQAMHRMWKVGLNAGLKDRDQLISRPAGVIDCEDITQIQEVVHTPLVPDAFNNSRETIQYMQDVTAAQDIIRGKMSRQEFATTASIMDSNAKQRLELHIYRMAKEGLSQLGDLLRQMLLAMYDPNSPLIAVLGKDEQERFAGDLGEAVDEQGFMQVGVKDLKGAMFATTEVSATEGDKRAVRQEKLQLLQTLLSLIPNGTPTGEVDEQGRPIFERVSPTAVVKDLFRLWGQHDIKNLIERVPIDPQTGMVAGPQQQPQRRTGEPVGAGGAPPVNEMVNRMDALDRGLEQGG